MTSAIAIEQSRLLELMEAERLKLSLRLESLRKTQAEMFVPAGNRQKIPDAVTNRKDLYRTALLVREANQISQYLNKNTVIHLVLIISKSLLLYFWLQEAITVTLFHHTSLEDAVVKSSANGLVGTGFTSQYQLQPRAGF